MTSTHNQYFFVTVLSVLFAVFFTLTSVLAAEAAEEEPARANYDESLVPKYTLPDPLIDKEGQRIETAKQWTDKRRGEVLRLFEENVYGKPTLSAGNIRMTVRLFDSTPVLDGKGVRHQFQLVFHTGKRPVQGDPEVDFLLYTPQGKADTTGKYPVFLGLNFMGNHAIYPDPGIKLKGIWSRKGGQTAPDPPSEESRGMQSRRWPLDEILARGYAVGTVYYGDFEPDFDGGMHHGVRRLIYKSDAKQAPNEANAIGTWAWGLSRLLDVLEEQGEKLHIDPARAIVIGHSRLGKTALWAGASDPRFAIVISNDSGCGGAALSRREYGETVHRGNTMFPHWFCDNYKKYNKAVNTLPVDQHELVALIAPRPVYVASASEDRWADPLGEFLAAFHADPVYRLLGTNGIGNVKDMPGPNTPVGDKIGYHLREGKHDIVLYDWIQYMNFADRHFNRGE